MKILLADDDRNNIELMKAILQRLNGEIETAANGCEALEKVKSFCPDIILLDVMMPEMDGYEVCARLKQEPDTLHIPVIMITTLSDRESRLKGLNAGADDFVSRPVDGIELLARIGNFLKMKEYRDEIRAKNSELERLQAFKKDLSDMIVHDLKGPLTCIQGYIQIAVMKNEEDKVLLGYLSSAQDACNSLLSMLNMLLDVGSMEDGKMPVNKAPLNAGDLLRKVRDLFVPVAERDAKQVLVVADDRLSIHGDADLLERVLQNLLSNALRHVESGSGEVSLAAVEDNGKALFSVSDNGRGVAAGFHRKIFEKYEQAGNSAVVTGKGQHGKNKGLGLHFCKLAVEAHGGEIWVESEEGQGSRFCFSMPTEATC